MPTRPILEIPHLADTRRNNRAIQGLRPVITRLLASRPRALNLLHAFGLASPFSQTIGIELACLARHATGRRCALEIGCFQGISASVIAKALDPVGKLYCVDPWAPIGDRENDIFAIAKRHFRRTGVEGRIVILQGLSAAMAPHLPPSLDFAFIDGDHSSEGLATDWAIVAPRMTPRGVVCLHDTTIPQSEPLRQHESVQYYDDFIRGDQRFDLIETVHSLNVLERIA